MFEGLLTRLATARGQIERRDYQGKGQSIHNALAIVDALQQCLDLERGGDLARNLDALYDYVTRRLFTANVDNSVALIDEVVDLVQRVKSGWDAIDPKERAR
jgi:flagellar protein FliS